MKKVYSSSCNKKDSINKFSVFFSTIVQNLRAKLFPLMECTWWCPDFTLSHHTDLTFSIDYINKVSIENELRKLKHKKSTGIDELPPSMLKNFASEISKPSHYIITITLYHPPGKSQKYHLFLNQGTLHFQKLSSDFNSTSII